MGSRILGFAGHKQAGKTTCSNFIHGYQMRAQGVIDNFYILENGQLIVDTLTVNADGKEEQSQGAIDISSNDPEFAAWAAYNMWPYVKKYSFASPLKEMAVGLFDLKEQQVYGTDVQKNTKTWFNWEDMPGVITDKSLMRTKAIKELVQKGKLQYHKPGRMTSREFLQFFGTDICRNIFPDIWQQALINSIDAEGSLVAVIDDCRFPNEVAAIQEAGGRVIYLTRTPYKDTHASEKALESCEDFDAVIDNNNLSVHDVNVEIVRLMDEWGWLGQNIKPTRPEAQNKNDEPQLVGGIHTIKEVE